MQTLKHVTVNYHNKQSPTVPYPKCSLRYALRGWEKKFHTHAARAQCSVAKSPVVIWQPPLRAGERTLRKSNDKKLKFSYTESRRLDLNQQYQDKNLTVERGEMNSSSIAFVHGVDVDSFLEQEVHHLKTQKRLFFFQNKIK